MRHAFSVFQSTFTFSLCSLIMIASLVVGRLNALCSKGTCSGESIARTPFSLDSKLVSECCTDSLKTGTTGYDHDHEYFVVGIHIKIECSPKISGNVSDFILVEIYSNNHFDWSKLRASVISSIRLYRFPADLGSTFLFQVGDGTVGLIEIWAFVKQKQLNFMGD